MKRRNNESLKKTEVGIVDHRHMPGWSVEQVLNFFAERGIARVIFSGGLDEWPREWFKQVSGGWVLVTYTHQTRTAVYERDSVRVTVTLQRNWADGSVNEFREQYRSAESDFARKFGFGFLVSPTLTGLYGVEASIPYKTPETVASDSFREYLHANTTQGRGENFSRGEFPGFQYWDRRFAYASDACGDLPTGTEQESSLDYFVPFLAAFYHVRFQVPADWQHVGLLPALTAEGWRWPRTPGSWYESACVAEPELRLAIESGWRVEVVRRWSFTNGRPLEKFTGDMKKLVVQSQSRGDSIASKIFRRITLNAYGGLYARSFERESFVAESELLERNDAAVLTAQPVEGGAMVQDRSAKRDSRFYMPEWTAYIWSRARARLAAAMLSIPFRDLLACHVDAVYSSRDLPEPFAGDSVGKFRLKGRIDAPVRVENARDFVRVRAQAEGVMNG